jgi:hypothetical protein
LRANPCHHTILGHSSALIQCAAAGIGNATRAASTFFEQGETAMENTIGFAAVAGAIFVSFAVALGMEWLSLVLLMKLMPARSAPQTVAQRLPSMRDRSGRENLQRKAA